VSAEVKHGPDRDALLELLADLADLLTRCGEGAWATRLVALATDVESAGSAAAGADVARSILALYGGMGSFSDVVLQDQDGALSQQQQFERMRSQLYDLARLDFLAERQASTTAPTSGLRVRRIDDVRTILGARREYEVARFQAGATEPDWVRRTRHPGSLLTKEGVPTTDAHDYVANADAAWTAGIGPWRSSIHPGEDT
jgi:hypothetical protein